MPDNMEQQSGDAERGLKDSGPGGAIFAALPDGALLFGMDGKVIAVNPAAEKTSGYTAAELVQGNAAEAAEKLVKQEDRQRVLETLGAVLQGKAAGLAPFTLVTKGGREVPMSFNAALIKDAQGNPIHVLATQKDLTGIKLAEEARRLFFREIIAAREGEQKKFAGAIHDIAGSMLVGLSSSLRLVEEELKHGGANRALVKVFQTKLLVKELVEMMKSVSADIWPPNLEIAGLAGALSELFSRVDSYSRIKVSRLVDLPDDWGKNHKRAGIVIYRLAQEALNNALKYSRAKSLAVIINYDADKVRFSISDDGCGFETNKPAAGRAGRGLNIMREQIESIGGNILIDSKPGCGTVVKAECPRHAESGGL